MSGNGVVIPGGLGDACADDCTYHALRGKTVELQAVGREDVFHRWTNGCSRARTCKVKMTSNLVVRAEFGLDRYEPAWAVPFTSSDCLLLADVAAADHIVMVGNFRGTASVGRATMTAAGDTDAVIASLRRANGEIEWVQRFGGAEFDTTEAPDVRKGADVVAGMSLGPGARVGPASVAGREDRIAWLDRDDGSVVGSVVVPGSLKAFRRLDDDGVIAVSAQSGRVTVTRLGSRGATGPLWATDLAASRTLSIDDLAIGPNRDVFVVGTLRGVPLFSAALSSEPSSTEHRIFLARLDGAAGSVKHASWLPLDGRTSLRGLAADARQLVVAGSASPRDSTEAFVLAMTFDGAIRWERRYATQGASGSVYFRQLDAFGGSFLLVGTTDGELELQRSRIGRRNTSISFVLELSASGDELWSFAMPPVGGDLFGLARDDDGDAYVSGWFREPFAFGGHTISPLPSGGFCGSAYVAKFVRTGDRSRPWAE